MKSTAILPLCFVLLPALSNAAPGPVMMYGPPQTGGVPSTFAFDGSLMTGTPVGSAEPLRASFAQATGVDTVWVYVSRAGEWHASLRAGGQEVGAVAANPNQAGWTALRPAEALVADGVEVRPGDGDAVILDMVVVGMDGEGLRLDAVPSGFTVAPGGDPDDFWGSSTCVTATVTVPANVSQAVRAQLSFNATHVAGAFSLRTSINNKATRGGMLFRTRGAAEAYTQKFDPTLLSAGANVITVCGPPAGTAPIHVSNLAVTLGASVDEEVSAAEPSVWYPQRYVTNGVWVQSGVAAGWTVFMDGTAQPVSAVPVASGTLLRFSQVATGQVLELTNPGVTVPTGVRLLGAPEGYAPADAALVLDSFFLQVHPAPRIAISGYVEGAQFRGGVNSVTVTGPNVEMTPVPVVDGHFAGEVRAAAIHADGFLLVTAQLGSGQLVQRMMPLGEMAAAVAAAGQGGAGPEANAGGEVVQTRHGRGDLGGAGQSSTALFGEEEVSHEQPISRATGGEVRGGQRVALTVPADAMSADTTVSMRRKHRNSLPPLAAGMINVTAPDGGGYRFLPEHMQFTQPTTLTLPYSSALLPPGFSAAEVRTYYFDEAEQQWLPLEKVLVDPTEETVISLTDHFTDMINAIMVQPETPNSQPFDPNSISGLATANPAANMILVAPPEPNNQGTANLQYPFTLPKGRGLYSPTLSLNYSSEGGAGFVGEGWTLSGSSVDIETRYGAPRYRASSADGPLGDRYLLDGQQLVPVASTPADNGMCSSGIDKKQFLLRKEGRFARIAKCIDGPGVSEFHWEVTEKDGTRFIYGATEDARVMDASTANAACTGMAGRKTARWLLDEVRDPDGNVTDYVYGAVDAKPSTSPSCCAASSQVSAACSALAPAAPWTARYLSHIRYTSRTALNWAYEVKFFYLARPGTPQVNAKFGFKVLTNMQLESVHVCLGACASNTIIREYSLAYTTPGASNLYKNMLASVSECSGVTDNPPPTPSACTFKDTTTFSYWTTAEAPTAMEAVLGTLGQSIWELPPGDLWPLTLNTSLSQGGNGGGQISPVGYDRAKTSVSVGAAANGSLSQSAGQVAFLDINGDGLADHVVKGVPSSGPLPFGMMVPGLDAVAFNTGSGFTTVTGSGIPTDPALHNIELPIGPLSTDFGVNVGATLEGNVGPDIISASATGAASAGFSASEFFPLDINGDGLMDFYRAGESPLIQVRVGNTVKFLPDATGGIPMPVVDAGPPTVNSQGVNVPKLARTVMAIGRERHPVWRWRAPRAGTININASVKPSFKECTTRPGLDHPTLQVLRAAAYPNIGDIPMPPLNANLFDQGTFGSFPGLLSLKEIVNAFLGSFGDPAPGPGTSETASITVFQTPVVTQIQQLNIPITQGSEVYMTVLGGCVEEDSQDYGQALLNISYVDPGCSATDPNSVCHASHNPIGTPTVQFRSDDDFRNAGAGLPFFVDRLGKVDISGTVEAEGDLADVVTVRIIHAKCPTGLREAVQAEGLNTWQFDWGGTKDVLPSAGTLTEAALFYNRMNQLASACSNTTELGAGTLNARGQVVTVTASSKDVTPGDLIYVQATARTPVDPKALKFHDGGFSIKYVRERPLADPTDLFDRDAGPEQVVTGPESQLPVHLTWQRLTTKTGDFDTVSTGQGNAKIRIYGAIPASWVGKSFDPNEYAQIIVQQDGKYVGRQSLALNPPSVVCPNGSGERACAIDHAWQLAIPASGQLIVSIEPPPVALMHMTPDMYDLPGQISYFRRWLSNDDITQWVYGQTYASVALESGIIPILSLDYTPPGSSKAASITSETNMLFPEGTFGMPLPLPMRSAAGLITTDGYRGFGYGEFFPLPGKIKLSSAVAPPDFTKVEAFAPDMTAFRSTMNGRTLGNTPLSKVVDTPGTITKKLVNGGLLKTMVPGIGKDGPDNLTERQEAIQALLPPAPVPQVFGLTPTYPVRIPKVGTDGGAGSWETWPAWDGRYEGSCSDAAVTRFGGASSRCTFGKRFDLNITLPGMASVADLKAKATALMEGKLQYPKVTGNVGGNVAGTLSGMGAGGRGGASEPLVDMRDMTGDGIPDMLVVIPGAGTWVFRTEPTEPTSQTPLWFAGPQSISMNASVAPMRGGGHDADEGAQKTFLAREGAPTPRGPTGGAGTGKASEGLIGMPTVNGNIAMNLEGVMQADINGDGLVDQVNPLMPCPENVQGLAVLLNVGNGYAPSYDCWTYPLTPLPLGNVPFTSDKMPIPVADALALSLPVPIGMGVTLDVSAATRLLPGFTGQSMGIQGTVNGSLQAQFADLVDMNGDGLPDRVLAFTDTLIYVQLNTGHGFAATVQWTAPSWAASLTAVKTVLPNATYRDVFVRRPSSKYTTELALDLQGPGVQGQTHVPTTLHYGAIGADFVTGLNNSVYQWGGTAPLLQQKLASSWGTDGLGLPWSLNRSMSAGVGLAASMSGGVRFQVWALGVSASGEVGSNAAINLNWRDALFQDFDGDGLPEPARQVFYTRTVNGVPLPFSALVMRKNKASGVNLLKHVDNPLKGQINIEYTRVMPNAQMPSGKWAMSRVTLFNGLHRQVNDIQLNSGAFPTANKTEITRTDYSYSGGVFDRSNKEFLGFSQVVIAPQLNTDSGGSPPEPAVPVKVECRFFDVSSYKKAGLVTSTVEALPPSVGAQPCAESSKFLGRTIHTYTEAQVQAPVSDQLLCPTPKPLSGSDPCTSTVQRKTMVQTFTYEPAGTALFQRAQEWGNFDAWGNPQSMTDHQEVGHLLDNFTGAARNTADDVTVAVQYQPVGTAYLAAHPTSLTVSGCGTVKPGCAASVLRNKTATYWPTGRMASVTAMAAGVAPLTSTYHWTSEGMLSVVYDPSGYRVAVTAYESTTKMFPTTISDNIGLTVTNTWDVKFGLPLVTIDPNTRTITRMYDEKGRLSRVDANGLTQLVTNDYAYISGGVPRVAETQHAAAPGASSRVSTYTAVDGFGQQVWVGKTAVINGTGGRVAVSGRSYVDALGRVRLQGQPENVALGSLGTLDTAIASAALVYPTRLDLDPRNRPLVQKQQPVPGGSGIIRTTTTSYAGVAGPALRTTTVDPKLYTSAQDQDSGGQTVAVLEYPVVGTTWTTRYEFDALDQLRFIRPQTGGEIEFQYDGIGRQASVKTPDTGVTTQSYDAYGRPFRKTDARLQVTENYYQEGTNRLDHVDRKTAVSGGTSYPTFTYVYGTDTVDNRAKNRVGRILKTLDELGEEELEYSPFGHITKRIRRPTAQTAYTTTFTIDPFGRVANMTYPDGELLTYTYNEGGEVTRAVGNAVYVDSVRYDEQGRKTRIIMGNPVTPTLQVREDFGFDAASGLLSSQQRYVGASLKQSVLMTYDQNTNVSSRQSTGFGTDMTGGVLPSAEVQGYTYDKLNRLTNATINVWYNTSGTFTSSHTFTYDANGAHNLTRKVQSVYVGGVLQTARSHDWTLGFPGGNHRATSATPASGLAVSFQFDAAGNMWRQISGASYRTLTWTPDGMLASASMDVRYPPFYIPYVTASGIYKYGADGERVFRQSYNGSTTTAFYYFGPHSSLTGTTTTKHVFLGKERMVTVTSNPSTGSYFYTRGRDHLGTSTGLFGQSGVLSEYSVLAPFGGVLETRSNTQGPGLGNRYLYTDKELDSETGYSYFGARYLDHTFARWVSPDPEWLKQGPIGLNPYQMTYWNPVKFIDPDGKAAALPLSVRLQRWVERKEQEHREYVDGLAAREQAGEQLGPFEGLELMYQRGTDALARLDPAPEGVTVGVLPAGLGGGGKGGLGVDPKTSTKGGSQAGARGRQAAGQIGDLRAGKDVKVKTVEEARGLLDKMTDLSPATESGKMPNPSKRMSGGFKDPPGTYRGDLINKADPTGPVHPGVDNLEHANNPHYNIHFKDGTKATIIISGE